MRSALALLFATLLCAGTAQAASISAVLSSDNSTCGNNIDGACSQNGAATYDDFGSTWNTSGGTSSNLVGVGSTSTTFRVNAGSAVDDGGADVGQSNDRSTYANLNFTITLSVDVDNDLDSWTVDLNQTALGLFALRGDGTASAVGNQDDSSASISDISVVVDGSNYNVDISPNSYSSDCSNNCEKSQQFSGGRNDLAILGGTGDATFSVTIDVDLSAFSNDGCSGFICSSASGGEEAAVLFGLGGQTDQAVDDYSTWGRSVGPDGYDGTFTLNVTALPEPSTLALGAVTLAGLAGAARRRTRR